MRITQLVEDREMQDRDNHVSAEHEVEVIEAHRRLIIARQDLTSQEKSERFADDTAVYDDNSGVYDLG